MKQLCIGLLIIFITAMFVSGQTETAPKEEKKSEEKVSAPAKTPAAETTTEKKVEEKKEEAPVAETTTEKKVEEKKEETPADDAKAVKDSSVSEQTDSEVKEEAKTVEESAQSSEAVDTTVGALTIVTVPESAVVIFDGAVKGKTPVAISDIVPGKHTILLKKKGHFAKKATVNVIGGSENELTFELAKPVHLSISSEPAGAAVKMNKKEVGTTPFMDGKLKPGMYDVTITLSGYKEEQHTVTLGSGERDSMHVTLMPLSAPPEDTSAVIEEKEDKKDKSRLASILDKVALGVFLGFSLIILLIELTQDK